MSDKTQISLSLNEKIVITGTSAIRNKSAGKLVAYNTMNGQLISETDLCQENVITCDWHPVLNQIFVGLSNS